MGVLLSRNTESCNKTLTKWAWATTKQILAIPIDPPGLFPTAVMSTAIQRDGDCRATLATEDLGFVA